MNSMQTEGMKVNDQGDRKIPLVRFMTLNPSQLPYLGSILTFCRERHLPPPEQYAMYGSVDGLMMDVAVPNIMLDDVRKTGVAMELYNTLCEEFGTDNVKKLVIDDLEIISQRVATIMSHATDNVFKTDEMEVSIHGISCGEWSGLVDRTILDCLKRNYIVEFVDRNNILGDIYHIKKVRKET